MRAKEPYRGTEYEESMIHFDRVHGYEERARELYQDLSPQVQEEVTEEHFVRAFVSSKLATHQDLSIFDIGEELT